MEQYINKDALVAEIEKVIDEPAPSHDPQCPWEDGYYCGLYKAESVIDTLEVKEVDFAKEFYNFSDKHKLMDKDIEFADIEKTASFFFQLGLKAQRGEKV